jgi:sporulation integral membrane protein YlbJ
MVARKMKQQKSKEGAMQGEGKIRLSHTRILFGGMALIMAVLLLRNAEATMEHVHRGMLICARTMIPSLFPFMVVSELIVKSGAGELIARWPARLLGPMLKLSRQGVCALLLGWLCGFPIGSRAAADYYRAGAIDAREFSTIVCCCNVPSSAFLVSAVGVSLFGDAALGRCLLLLAIASSLTVGLLLRWLLPKEQGRPIPSGSSRTVVLRASQLLPSAVASAASSMLNVCATVLLFSALVGTLTGSLDALALSPTVRTAIYGVLELSTGVCAASALSSPVTAAVLCAVMVGWAGLSVHCQILAVCDGCPIAMGAFWGGRAWQALCCGAGMIGLINMGCVTPQAPPEPAVFRDVMVGQNVAWQTGSFAHVFSVVCGVLFLAALVFLTVWRVYGKKRGGRCRA